MRLRRVDALPRLAWCARLSRGSRECVVHHGPGVETWEEAFCEGAWDGPFAEGGFADAVTFTGTGGRARGDALVFASGTGLGDRLYLLRTGRELLVSNSAVFVMAAAGDEPSWTLPYADQVYLRQAREGLHARHRFLPTRRGAVEMHECANLVVSPDLAVQRHEKPAPARAPEHYKGYVELLEGAIRGVFANGADPARRAQRYRPLATVSCGYDSPSLAVLAARAGCREAATFAVEGDDGRAIGACLGLATRAYPFGVLPDDRPFPEAEFCVCPHGTTRDWLCAEPDLAGVLLLSGAPGGYLLQVGKEGRPGLRRDPSRGMGGTQNEFRLRVGFNVFKPYFTGWQHAEAIQRITRSEEMRPYWIGGDYDKPIARRILEEAGVPREAFGQAKHATVERRLRSPRDLCEASRRDYYRFVRTRGVPRWIALRSRLVWRLLAPVPRGLRPRLLRRIPPRWRLAPRFGYLYHWGFHRIRDRYAPAAPR